jgi:hypothetical protein
MRHFILLGFFLFATLLGNAQVPPAVVSAPPLVGAPVPAADTVVALHNFYQHKRRALPRVLLITGGVFALTFFVREVLRPTRTYGQYTTLGEALVPYYIGALSIPIVGGELLYYRQYNKRHERRTIEAFRAHQLRPYIQKQLEPKYFQPTPPRDKRTEKVYWR